MNGTSNFQNTLNSWRIASFLVVVAAILIIYLARLFTLQVLERDLWLAKSEENRILDINLAAPRGIIYDRNGYVLARNIAAYHVVITPASLPDDPGEVQEVYRQLSPLVEIPVSRGVITDTMPYVECISEHGITQIVEYGLTTAPYNPVRVACNVTLQVAMVVQEGAIDLPGVGVEVVPVRDYPTSALTASIIGYLGPISPANQQYYTGLGFVPNRDKVGYAGVEYTFQDLLAGQTGLRVVERDIGGQVIRDLAPIQEPVPGSNIRLTIDTRLQQAVDAILQDEIDDWNIWFSELRMTSGVAIVINPQTGEILAMVSYPTYENSRMARLIPSYYYQQLEADLRKPLLNHAVGDELPTGSVFKLVTAVGALNEGVVTPRMIIETPGQLIVEEQSFPGAPTTQRQYVDWNYLAGGFGQLDFLRCIANSSNVCFYKVGGGWEDEIPDGLGICRLGTYARALGYGEYPGTGLPEEENGLVPDPEYKRIRGGESWTTGDTYLASVGQGFVLSTPLQVLMSAATIANDGRLMEPTILRDVLDGEGNIIQPFVPRLRWDLTVDPVIEVYEPGIGLTGCMTTGETRTIDPWVFQSVQEGMRFAVTEGTLSSENTPFGFEKLNIAVAGKTGTAEYCDAFAIEKRGGQMCDFGDWPTHAWTVAYAPYDNPEIAVVAFVYNGGEGAKTAAPIVRRIIQAYFELKAIDNALITQ